METNRISIQTHHARSKEENMEHVTNKVLAHCYYIDEMFFWIILFIVPLEFAMYFNTYNNEIIGMEE